ncbi:hypothetical protein DQ04_02431020 [Trypanosoma grayi]|uniref:hypothetical protein n=1 Tax=Trypanosoma grayi TaxID=71804 RepID=UPI0004F3FD89|nr:hypothetical protein DQ04_02431020 [Trypanosoma grayi]KEG11622.1 hypothetical protein DQ04_02431020 [Trypanosoma grayi]
MKKEGEKNDPRHTHPHGTEVRVTRTPESRDASAIKTNITDMFGFFQSTSPGWGRGIPLAGGGASALAFRSRRLKEERSKTEKVEPLPSGDDSRSTLSPYSLEHVHLSVEDEVEPQPVAAGPSTFSFSTVGGISMFMQPEYPEGDNVMSVRESTERGKKEAGLKGNVDVPRMYQMRDDLLENSLSKVASLDALLGPNCSHVSKSSPQHVQQKQGQKRQIQQASADIRSSITSELGSSANNRTSGVFNFGYQFGDILDWSYFCGTIPRSVSLGTLGLSEGALAPPISPSEGLRAPGSETFSSAQSGTRSWMRENTESQMSVQSSTSFSLAVPLWVMNRVNTAVILSPSPHNISARLTVLPGNQVVEIPKFWPSLGKGQAQATEQLKFDEVIRVSSDQKSGFGECRRLSGLFQLFVSGHSTVVILGCNTFSWSLTEELIMYSIRTVLARVEKEEEAKTIASFDITLRICSVKSSENKACDLLSSATEFKEITIARSHLYGLCPIGMEEVDVVKRLPTLAQQITDAYARSSRERGVNMVVAAVGLKQVQNTARVSVLLSSLQLIILSDPASLVRGGSATSSISTIVQRSLSGPSATLLIGHITGMPGHKEWLRLISEKGEATVPSPQRFTLDELLRETVVPEQPKNRGENSFSNRESGIRGREESGNPFEGRTRRRSSVSFREMESFPLSEGSSGRSQQSESFRRGSREEGHRHKEKSKKSKTSKHDKKKKREEQKEPQKEDVEEQQRKCLQGNENISPLSTAPRVEQRRLSEKGDVSTKRVPQVDVPKPFKENPGKCHHRLHNETAPPAGEKSALQYSVPLNNAHRRHDRSSMTDENRLSPSSAAKDGVPGVRGQVDTAAHNESCPPRAEQRTQPSRQYRVASTVDTNVSLPPTSGATKDQKRANKVRTMLVLTNESMRSNPISTDSAGNVSVRLSRGANPIVLFTADEVLPSFMAKDLAQSKEIKELVRLFATGHNTALLCNTVHSFGDQGSGFVAMPEWFTIAEEIEALLDKELIPKGCYREVHFSMCVIEGQKVVRDILRRRDDNDSDEPLTLCYSPLLGINVSGAACMKVKESRYVQRLRAAVNSATEFMRSEGNSGEGKLLLASIVLEQVDGLAADGRSTAGDAVLSGLLVASSFSSSDVGSTRAFDLHELPANPYIAVGTGQPNPLFRFALGGPCHTLSCVTVGGNTCGSSVLAILRTQRAINAIMNATPVRGSVRQFLERSEEEYRQMQKLNENIQRGSESATAISMKMERLKLFIEDYTNLLNDPMNEDPTYIPGEHSMSN